MAEEMHRYKIVYDIVELTRTGRVAQWKERESRTLARDYAEAERKARSGPCNLNGNERCRGFSVHLLPDSTIQT